MNRILFVLICASSLTLWGQKDPLEWCAEIFHGVTMPDTTGLYSASFHTHTSPIIQLFLPDTITESKRSVLPDFTYVRKKNWVQIRPFSISEDYYIINVTAKDPDETGKEFYLHFKYEKKAWKLTALHELNRMTVADLWMAQLSDEQVDSVLHSDSERKILRSREQFEYIKGLYNLTLSLDDTLVKYFEDNEIEIKRIKDLYDAERQPGKTQNKIRGRIFEEFNPQHLFLTELEGIHLKEADLTRMYILNNFKGSIGYMYISNPDFVEKILLKNNIFILRPLGDNWYLFKGNGRG
ncbi:MAG: hypothetical protein N4A41_09445 [Crocinitomicaceae bacterium]|jgi:hypothetical protein|nr:hypothetical protein [Crocinitomicaceae bacterium]